MHAENLKVILLLRTITTWVTFCTFHLSRDTGLQYLAFGQQGSSTSRSCDTWRSVIGREVFEVSKDRSALVFKIYWRYYLSKRRENLAQGYSITSQKNL